MSVVLAEPRAIGAGAGGLPGRGTVSAVNDRCGGVNARDLHDVSTTLVLGPVARAR